MKRSEIYREAARRLFVANDHFAGLNWLHDKSREAFDAFNSEDAFGDEFFFANSVQEVALALCFMAAIAEDEENA